MLRHVITGGLDPASVYGSEALKTVSDYCIVCGMCAVECPSNVNIPKLMLEAKSRYRAEHRGASAEAVLSRAEPVSKLASALAPVTNSLLKSTVVRRVLEPVTGIDHRRPMATYTRCTGLERPDSRLASEVYGRHRETGARGRKAISSDEQTQATATSQPLVAYFHDLYARYNDPELARLSLKVLRAHGLRTVVPPQRASGVPEMLYGYAEAARRAALVNLEHLVPLVEQGATVVGSEPTAIFALKIHYPDYLAGEASSLVANAAHDLGEFLVRYRADRPESSPTAAAPAGRTVPLRVAYHLPCHLKAQQVGSPALRLLREIPGVEVTDLAAGCCGMAGTFGMKTDTYDLSMAAGRPLFDRVAAVAPDVIVSECSTCRLQLAHATGLEAIHPITLLADAYGLEMDAVGVSRRRR